jgi:hypothetical protein
VGDNGAGLWASHQRHLREHGKPFWIVLLEIVLGATLIQVSSAVDGDTDGTS